MFKAVLLDKDCWIANMRLDSATGLDPEGVRLRAAQGLEAADYLVPGQVYYPLSCEMHAKVTHCLLWLTMTPIFLP
jgi:hypothetical protein